jgi:hypothetical protein
MEANLPNGNTLAGVAKQPNGSAPEPFFPTGTKAPNHPAATLRVASTNATLPGSWAQSRAVFGTQNFP